MKGDVEIVGMILFFVGGFAISAILSRPALPVSVGDIVNPASTLVAAFAGSWAAFKYQAKQRSDDVVRENIAAGNSALLTLLQQQNTLMNYRDAIIEPLRESPGRHIGMRPSLPYREGHLAFEVKSLDFLVGKTSVKVLLDLVMEELRYSETIKAINWRSAFHNDVIHPKLYDAGISDGVPFTEEDAKRALGELDYARLLRITDAIVRQVDLTIESLGVAKRGLRTHLVERYPLAEFFIDWEA